MNTEVKKIVEITDEQAQYDENAKRILGNKIILAHILVHTVEEFRGMNPKEVVSYIEGNPYIGSLPLDPGMTNAATKEGERIIGFNSENSDINEGLIRFDIVFYVRMKDGLTQMIINIEAQKDEPVGYSILNRAIFYVARLISSQKERDFVGSNYDDIRKVSSIWICMNMNENSLTHVHLESDKLVGDSNWKGKLDLLNIVFIGLAKDMPENRDKYELHRLLGALLSATMSQQQKFDIIEKEFDIPLEDNLRKDVGLMCNLSQGIVDDTKLQIIMNMYKKNYTVDQIADIVEKSVAEVEVLIKENLK